MRIATLRTAQGHRAARIDSDVAYLLPWSDVAAVLTDAAAVGATWTDLVEAAEAVGSTPLTSVDFAPVIPRPGKIVCVGLNYAKHITEMGRELPEFPTLFAKYPEALIGARDSIIVPPESDAVDWEAELALVIGTSVRRADPERSEEAIAGFSIMNDVTMRDWQYRSPMWLQGKTFEASSPFGPVLVSPDELPGGVRPRLDISSILDGEVMQSSNTDDLVFDPPSLVAYVSTIMTLRPGDVIATGTPGGVGHARKPARYITTGQTLTTKVSKIGELVNTAVAETLG
jgi:acylpyruvate hydrolase